jgi:hypothetical protein
MPRRVNSGLFPAGSQDIRSFLEKGDSSEEDEEVEERQDEEAIVMTREMVRVLSASSGNTKKSIVSMRGSVATEGRVAFAF